MVRIFLLAFSLVALNLPSAWSFTSPDSDYEKVFPNYIEFCGFGQMHQGNWGGHAFIYLKGVCRDQSTEWPSIRHCTESELAENPQRGTAVSVDPLAINQKWFAVEDLSFILYGNLKQDEPLDSAAMNRIIDQALQKEIYKNVIPTQSLIKQKEKQHSDISMERFIAQQGFGTDYGVALIREGSCWKFPVSHEQLDDVILEANRENVGLSEKNPNYFDFITDNCVHFSINLLSKAGLLNPVPIREWFPINLTNIHLPTSEMAQIGSLVKKGIPSVVEAYENHRSRETLLQFKRLPIQYGALLELIPYHDYENPNFPRSGRFAFPGDLERLIKMEKDPVYTDLKTHFQSYFEQLTRAKAQFESTSLEQILAHHRHLQNEDFKSFFDHYKNWLNQAVEEVKQLSQGNS